MKKALALLLTAALLTLLCACGKTAAPETAAKTTTVARTENTRGEAFTADQVYGANRTSQLLQESGCVKAISVMGDRSTEEYLYLLDGSVAYTQKTTERDGSTLTSAAYRGLYVSDSGSGKQVTVPLRETDAISYEDYFAALVADGTAQLTSKTATGYFFDIVAENGMTFRYAVNPKTLALLSYTELNADGSTAMQVTFDYAATPEDFGLLQDWSGKTRTVTFDCSLDSDESFVKTVAVPAAWEPLPSHAGGYQLFSDKKHTKPYAYPGDGTDYTVYVTR